MSDSMAQRKRRLPSTEHGQARPPRAAVFDADFREDLRYWVATDRRLALRVLELVDGVMRDPFVGIGKPEPLKRLGSGVWSRRIDQEHRLVYVVSDERIDFIQARYHY
jgi:toxin YoeB